MARSDLLNEEIIITSNDQRRAKAISRAVKKGLMRKLAPRIYSSNLTDTPENLIRRHIYYILGQLFPYAVISHRSALEGGVSDENMIVLSYQYNKNFQLPGVLIKLVQAKQGPIAGDTAFLGNLYLASRPRALLENLQASRRRQTQNKTLTIDEIERWLDKIARVYGVPELNRLRDEAKTIANILSYEKELVRLENCISAILGTKPATILVNKLTQARATGQAYDPNRLELFSILSMKLQSMVIETKRDNNLLVLPNKNFAFFDSYFSNFIEGTEFAIEEAEEIIFKSKIIKSRPQDSHDILGVFQIASDPNEMKKVPKSIDELILILKHRHMTLMSARPEKDPGQFKNSINRVGNTVFVRPDEVLGTLQEAFNLYQQLEPGFARAAFMMFMISEVHPFLDGNGRIARIMMNAELFSAGQCRIIIPTVYQEDYLLALRKLSRDYEPEAYIKMLLHAQAWVEKISFAIYETALMQLKICHAFLLPNEGQLKML